MIALIPRSHANFHGVRSSVQSTVAAAQRRRGATPFWHPRTPRNVRYSGTPKQETTFVIATATVMALPFWHYHQVIKTLNGNM